MLDNTTANYSTKEEKVYCRVCYGKKLGPKGYGFGSGAGCLSTETGRQFGNKESDMTLVFVQFMFILFVKLLKIMFPFYITMQTKAL